jgi:hypothetical protein
MPGADRRPALEDRADRERCDEEHEREPDPGLGEIPHLAVDHEPNPEADQGEHRGREHQWADDAEAFHETRDRLRLAAAKHLRRQHPNDNEPADPEHRGEDVDELEPCKGSLRRSSSAHPREGCKSDRDTTRRIRTSALVYSSMPSLRSSTIADLRQRIVSGEKGSMNGIPFSFRSGFPSRSRR